MLSSPYFWAILAFAIVAFFAWLRRVMEKGAEKEKKRATELTYRKERLLLIRTMLHNRPDKTVADDGFWHTLTYANGCIQHQRDGDYDTIVLRHSGGDITLFFINGALSPRFPDPLDHEEEFHMMAINDSLSQWEHMAVQT